MYKIKKENTKVEVEMTIDNKEWNDAVELIYQQNKAKYSVEGFRKGHAPRKVIEKTYGDGVFFDDTFNYFYEKTMNEILSKNPEYEPVVQPRTELQSYTIEAGLKATIKFEIVPDFKLCDYKGISIKVPDTTVCEHDIQHEIDHLLEDNAKFEKVDRPAKLSDSVLIDFKGFLNDVEFAGGSANDYVLVLGSHSFIDNFEDQLVGHKAGDNVDVHVTFPADYPSQELKGQPTTFKVLIKEVREKQLPTFNDKFVADTTEFETVDEYRKDITAHIQSMKSERQKEEFEFGLRDYLVEHTDIQIPEEMIEVNTRNDMARMSETLKMYGLTLEDYVRRTTGSDIESYQKEVRKRVVSSIKARYIFRKIIDENNLEPSASEYKKKTKGLTKPEDIAKAENDLLLDALWNFLRDNNKMDIQKHCHND